MQEVFSSDTIEEFVQGHNQRMDELEALKDAVYELEYLSTAHGTLVLEGVECNNVQVKKKHLRFSRRCYFCRERSRTLYFFGESFLRRFANHRFAMHFHIECLFLEGSYHSGTQKQIKAGIFSLLESKRQTAEHQMDRETSRRMLRFS